MTRAIGRERSEESPVRTEKNCCGASRPASKRIVVPELRQSRTPSGSRRPWRPAPVMRRVESSSLPRSTQLTQAAQSGQAILSDQEVLDDSVAFSDRVEDRGAMGDRFMTGWSDRAPQALGGADASLHQPYVSSPGGFSSGAPCFCARRCSSLSRSRWTPSATFWPNVESRLAFFVLRCLLHQLGEFLGALDLPGEGTAHEHRHQGLSSVNLLGGGWLLASRRIL